jgi:hypothetical protein
MPNVNAAQGFKPLRHLGGGVIRHNEYRINTTGSTGFNDNIFTGDVVKMNADGTVESAAAGDMYLGVFAGCQYTSSDGSVQFSRNWVASTAVKSGTEIVAWVYDDPMIAYEVQAATAASTDVGAVVDIVVGTGNAVTGQSGSSIDVSDTTTSGGFRIMRLVPRPDNAFGAYAKLEVVPAAATLKATAGV